MSKKFVDTHVHIVGTGRSFTNLQDKIRTVEDVINLNSRYPEIYQARLTEEPVDISDVLIQEMDRHGITHAIIQQTPGTGNNDLVAETVKKHPVRLFGLLSFERGVLKPGEKVNRRPGNWPSEEQMALDRAKAADEVTRGVEVLGLKGVGEFERRKFTMQTHPEKIVNDFAPFMEVIAKYKIPVQIATAWTQFPHGLFYGDPIWADELAYSYPEVPIILTKMGRGILHLFENALSVARRNVNVYFDILQSTGEHIRRAVDAIGADRIMFGTDWSPTWRWLIEPADRYTMQLKVLDDANLTASEREQIEWRTAEKVFRLDL
ncbi:amidohydrolase family protein [Chloroflexota bacterium]